VICHPNNYASDPFSADGFGASWQRTRESLAWLAEMAQRAGVRMAVENLPSRGLPRPGARVCDVLRMIEGLGAHVGVCLDAGHSNANGLSAAAEATEAGERLFALHIQDTDGLGDDQHWLPGRGTTDWPALLRALDKMRFVGARTFEVGASAGLEETIAALAALRGDWSTL
jgi:sugar phosphate isomerase/epimerase